MGETLENVVNKLNAIPGYREQFNAVFGTDVTTAGIAKAIATFERSIVSGPSPYDLYVGGDRTALSPAARRGLGLFNGKGHCTPCHSGPLFSNQSFHNLGVGMDRAEPDLGRFDHGTRPTSSRCRRCATSRRRPPTCTTARRRRCATSSSSTTAGACRTPGSIHSSCR
jgi:cytochrome c peroxidase